MNTLDFPVRIPADILVALGEFSGHTWSDSLALEPIICEAIQRYLQDASASAPQPAAPSNSGYQWKQVFLPDGTRLRTCFGGRSHFAHVEGEEIKYDGQVISPSRFANLHGSGNRNAWKVIWLSFAGSQEWIIADVFRSARKESIARMLAGG